MRWSHKLRFKVSKPRVKARNFSVRLQLRVSESKKNKKNFLRRYDFMFLREYEITSFTNKIEVLLNNNLWNCFLY